METSELLKKVRALEVKTKMITRDLFQGDYHSAFKGRGMSFSEVREYSYGDDVRNIDWNVTARTSTPFVKVFEEERELTLMLMIDVSPSTRFGTHLQSKNELILELAALLSFSAIGNQDKVGALFFTETIEKYIPPKKGKQNILFIIREMIQFQPKGSKTDIGPALEYLSGIQKKKSICFIVSDFLGKNYSKALSVAAKKHDVIGIHISDEREKNLPDIGLIPVCDPETNSSSWLDTSSKQVRQHYKNEFENHVLQTEKTFTEAGADLIRIQTGEDYYKILHSFFRKRSGK